MWIVLMFVAGVGAALVEARRDSYRDGEEWRREVRISIVLGGFAAGFDAILPGASFANAGAPSIALAIVVFIADDFFYYASHRLSHRVAVFWASHAVHHSPVRYDFLTGLRQPPTWLLTPAALAPVILLAMGAPGVLVAASAVVRGLHHFVIHTERVRHLPRWVEFVFNTPSHHRVHHSIEEGCLDRNFGGVLIVWDRLFGTFATERAEGVRRYGVLNANARGAWDVFAQPWRKLFGQVAQARSLSARLAVLLSPPSAKADRQNPYQGVMASPIR